MRKIDTVFMICQQQTIQIPNVQNDIKTGDLFSSCMKDADNRFDGDSVSKVSDDTQSILT